MNDYLIEKKEETVFFPLSLLGTVTYVLFARVIVSFSSANLRVRYNIHFLYQAS